MYTASVAERVPESVRRVRAVSHLAGFRRVSYEELLASFESRSMVASSLGAQLERLRDGVSGGSADYVRAQGREEMARLHAAGLLRCVEALATYRSIRWGECECDTTRRVAKRAGLGDGAVAVHVLAAYQPWATSWSMRGLVAVHQWHCSVDPSVKPLATDGAQRMREGKAKAVERVTASLVADAQLVARGWIERWNRRVFVREQLDAAE